MSETSEPQPGAGILGVDHGERYIGLAVSDALGITAQPLRTLEVSSIQDAVEQVAAVAQSRNVGLVVVGYPVLLSGREGEVAKRVDRFIAALAERTGLPVERWDERLTTSEARRLLQETGGGGAADRRPKREARRGGRGKLKRRSRGAVDRIAASLLLESYLARNRPSGEVPPDAGRRGDEDHRHGVQPVNGEDGRS